MALNRVMLIANVGADPEIRDANGAKVASFRVATTEKYKDRNGEFHETTEWHAIVAWRNLADIVEKHVKKGAQLYIEGKLRTRSYESNGTTKYVTEVTAERIQLLGKKEEKKADYEEDDLPPGF